MNYAKSSYLFIAFLFLIGIQGTTINAQNAGICDTIVNMEPPPLTLDRAFYEEQLVRYDDALLDNPNDFELLTLRGDSHLALEQYEAAIADFSQAITVDPTATYPLARLGDTYQQVFSIEAAIDAYTRAIELDANYTYAYIKRGIAYRKVGDASDLDIDAVVYKLSLDDFNTAIRLDRTSSLAFARRSELFLSLRNFEQSFADARDAINVGSQYAFAHTVMANLYKGNSNFSLAFASIQTALNTPTENGGAYAYAYTMAAEMCWRMGDRASAIQALAISQRYDSSFSATDIVLARVAIDIRDTLEPLNINAEMVSPSPLLLPNLVTTVPTTLLDQLIVRYYVLAAQHNPTNPFVFSQLRYLPIAVSAYQNELDIFQAWQALAISFEPDAENNEAGSN